MKQSPLAVLGVLRDLYKNQIPIRLSWSSGQFISKILEVTATGLIVDFGSQKQENQAVSTPRLSFRFLNVNPAVERELQRIIFSLERAAREKQNGLNRK